ncbi:fucosyltransferase [Aphelenchoides avenae]|nr:fucosyltransferase [Aphelenchus avenae]
MRNCFVTLKYDDVMDADVVLLGASSQLPDDSLVDRSSQLWVLYLLESPSNTAGLERFNGKINYTASYRWDSDLLTPYGALTRRTTPLALASTTDYSAGKSGKVAWFVSNCVTANNRMQYARELARHIQVDIFGGCVDKRVPASGEREEMLRRDYKFFLAFENSNCVDYVTEKFFDALGNDVIPIAFGETVEFYTAIAPPHSFIHVEQFASAEELAKYLHQLDKDPTAYNEYFRWKRDWRLMDTKFWCRLCSFAQEPTPNVHNDVHGWWHHAGVCRSNFTGM